MDQPAGQSPEAGPDKDTVDIEREKLGLERDRYRADIWRWIIAAIGAIVSFAVIDYGKLRLEQYRARTENHRALLDSYLRATESPQPDVWIRKLNLLIQFSDDDQLRAWAQSELLYIKRFAALDTLYRETLKVASQLVEPSTMGLPERSQANQRFNQLYWADLPFAGESTEVSYEMVKFREQLLKAESAGEHSPSNPEWEALNISLITLSRTLKEAIQKGEQAK